MSDTTNDIDALFQVLAHVRGTYEHRATLNALVAERDGLRKRVEELESHPPADRDRELRERLVCAIWPELLRLYSEYAKSPAVRIDPREEARRFALTEADEMIAAMQNGEQP